MFTFPLLTVGFLFVAVPLLVHLINMLRHKRQRWAAMDFLLQSYRKQKKWIRLRQLLLLFSRIVVATLLIAMLCGWTGGGQAMSILGGTTTHHVVVLDDSYSMGDTSLAKSMVTNRAGLPSNAYGRSLGALQDLTERLAADDSNHQLTVMRASRAAMAVRGGVESGDAAADVSAQTITGDGRVTSRLMATQASSIRCDLTETLDLASELISSTPADATYLYIASDFRKRDWGSPERLTQALRKLSADVSIRMIDCATNPGINLAITDLTPVQDVWVSGVPVVVNVTIKNYSQTVAKNVPLQTRVIRYGDGVATVDPTRKFSGKVESLPTMVIESLPPGGTVTKTFQVYVTETGTHALEASLPADVLMADNSRTCTLPLSGVERVLVIDGGDQSGGGQDQGAYHIATALNPGSQVRIGAVPEVKPASFLRSATWESLAPYRAVYLTNVQEIGANAADALNRYVRRGGGLAMFLGENISPKSYNQNLFESTTPNQSGTILPGRLVEFSDWDSTRIGDPAAKVGSSDMIRGEDFPVLLGPLENSSENPFALVGVAKSWTTEFAQPSEQLSDFDPIATNASANIRVHRIVDGRDGRALVTLHALGGGRVVTVMTGLESAATNWPGDPTFVVFLLQANAALWSGASPPTQRPLEAPITKILAAAQYTGDAAYLPAASEPPRVPIEVASTRLETNSQDADSLLLPAKNEAFKISIDPQEMVINGEAGVENWLTPGISEWSLTRIDGSQQVVPTATVIAVGEGELARADQAEITQALLPVEVRFVTSSAWSEQNRIAGSSTLSLLLLGILGLSLAAEQALAYWASYHVNKGRS